MYALVGKNRMVVLAFRAAVDKKRHVAVGSHSVTAKLSTAFPPMVAPPTASLRDVIVFLFCSSSFIAPPLPSSMNIWTCQMHLRRTDGSTGSGNQCTYSIHT